MRAELELAIRAARVLPAEELPRFLGELEEISWTAKVRLTAPPAVETQDVLLDVKAAAEKLGISADYLYRHSREFPFTRRMGRALRFSSAGIEKHLRTG